MLKIVYCDNDEKDRIRMMNALTCMEEKWNQEFEVITFTCGEELCKSLQTTHYDIIMLDVYMKEMDGIETAARIRSMGEETLIIFISEHDGRVKELFDFRTIAFLDKPLQIEKLESALKRACEILDKNHEETFIYRKNKIVKYVPVKDIIYFESKRNSVKIYTTKYEDFFYGTLSNVWERVQKTKQFIMPSKSFVFNLRYVELQANTLMLNSTSQVFNIGMKYKEDTANRYFQYRKNKCKEI